MVNPAAQELGKKGGQAKSEAKTNAARKNASKPRRGKWVTAFGFVVRDRSGKDHFGHVIVPKKMNMDFATNSDELWSMMENAIKWAKPEGGLEMIEFAGGSIRV